MANNTSLIGKNDGYLLKLTKKEGGQKKESRTDNFLFTRKKKKGDKRKGGERYV